jgi:hypothetical protein
MTRKQYKACGSTWHVMECSARYYEANYGKTCPIAMSTPFENVLRLQVLVGCLRRLEFSKDRRRHWLNRLINMPVTCPLP